MFLKKWSIVEAHCAIVIFRFNLSRRRSVVENFDVVNLTSEIGGADFADGHASGGVESGVGNGDDVMPRGVRHCAA